jgi:hypothetical protein
MLRSETLSNGVHHYRRKKLPAHPLQTIRKKLAAHPLLLLFFFFLTVMSGKGVRCRYHLPGNTYLAWEILIRSSCCLMGEFRQHRASLCLTTAGVMSFMMSLPSESRRFSFSQFGFGDE